MTPENPRQRPPQGGPAPSREPTVESPPESRSRRQPRPPRKPPSSEGLRNLLVEIYSIAREMLRLPVGVYFAVAEFFGKWILVAWLAIRPWLVAGARATIRLVRFLERELTPARGVALVALCAAVVLAISQFSDYRGVDIGSDAYANVSTIAPAPQVDQATAGSAHAWAGLPIALLAVVLTILALRRRPGLARLLMPLGFAVVAISLLVDMPKGLDEGNAAVAYDQVHARLLGGFWAQISAGVVLIVVAPLLAGYLKGPRKARRGRGSPPSLVARMRRGGAPVSAKASGTGS
jgi:hypothetical protein